MKERFEVEKTKSGKLAMWEWGGGFTSTGDAAVIANADGSPKKAIYIRRKGHLANAEHALVTVSQGDFVVKLYRRRSSYIIRVYEIVDFERKEHLVDDGRKLEYWYAIAEERYCFGDGKWNSELPEFLNSAVQAAREKSCCYHCREPHFIA